MDNPTNKTSNKKKDTLFQTLVNLGTVIVFFIIVVLIYKLFIKADYNKLKREGFENIENFFTVNPTTTIVNPTTTRVNPTTTRVNPTTTKMTEISRQVKLINDILNGRKASLSPEYTEPEIPVALVDTIDTLGVPPTPGSRGSRGRTSIPTEEATPLYNPFATLPSNGPVTAESQNNPNPARPPGSQQGAQTPPGTSSSSSQSRSQISINTIYEKSVNNIFGQNKRFVCSLMPTMNPNSNICKINNTPYILYKFPVHIIKLLDDSILAVFNDGYIYTKNNMDETIWQGPIENSMPQGDIPLRMITLSTDLITILGVGYDNILYIKAPNTDDTGLGTSINFSAKWKQVPNNANIIYVLFDNTTNFLISIDITGKLLTKVSTDITSYNKQLNTLLDRPVLRLYYDLNGYMLAIDNNFDLYQFSDLNWKNSPLQIERGPNPSKVNDILYDNDGKLYGLVFSNDEFKLVIQKQKAVFYLSDFYKLDVNFNKTNKNKFLLSNQDILKSKLGSIDVFLTKNSFNDNTTDDDTNFAYQKQIMDTEAKLRQFCASRGSNTQNTNFENYDLIGNVENNNDKIVKLQNIVKNLLIYEPDSKNMIDKYPILNK